MAAHVGRKFGGFPRKCSVRLRSAGIGRNPRVGRRLGRSRNPVLAPTNPKKSASRRCGLGYVAYTRYMAKTESISEAVRRSVEIAVTVAPLIGMFAGAVALSVIRARRAGDELE